MKLEAWGTKAVSLYLYTHESMADQTKKKQRKVHVYEKTVARKERKICVKLIHRCTYTASERRIQLRERYRHQRQRMKEKGMYKKKEREGRRGP